MKKFTKRLTMIVAILLSLVLLTSSIVSTTLAKYVVAKSAIVNAQLDKFGVTVELNSTDLSLDTSKTKQTGDSYSYTYQDVLLHPGDEKKITVSLHGEPTVDSEVIVEVIVDYDPANFTVDKTAFTDFTENKVYFPIQFKVGDTVSSSAYTQENDEAVSSKINGTIKTELTKGNILEEEDGKIKWAKGAKIDASQKKNISLSFSWPKDGGTTDNMHNEIGTWLAEHKNSPTFTITYKITVQQA